VDDFDGGVVDDVEGHDVVLPAGGREAESGVGWGQSADESGEELEIIGLVLNIASEDGVLDGLLHNFGVVLVEQEVLLVVIKVLWVAKETLFGEDDLRFRSFGGFSGVVDSAEWVIDLSVRAEVEERSGLLEDLGAEDAGGGEEDEECA